MKSFLFCLLFLVSACASSNGVRYGSGWVTVTDDDGRALVEVNMPTGSVHYFQDKDVVAYQLVKINIATRQQAQQALMQRAKQEPLPDLKKKIKAEKTGETKTPGHEEKSEAPKP